VTGGRQLERTRLAFEQAHAEDIFELFHLMADCGGCQRQLFGRDLEAPMARGDAKRTQIAQRGCSG
jgi:hypothetical protein